MPANPSPPIAPTEDFEALLYALEFANRLSAVVEYLCTDTPEDALRVDAARKAVEDYVAVLEAELKILRGTNGTQR